MVTHASCSFISNVANAHITNVSLLLSSAINICPTHRAMCILYNVNKYLYNFVSYINKWSKDQKLLSEETKQVEYTHGIATSIPLANAVLLERTHQLCF